MPVMTIYLETEPDKANEITRAEIMATSDVELLCSWFEDLEEFKAALRSQVEARIETETDDEVWLCRVADKMSFCGRGMAVIKRRLRTLGVEAPDEAGRVRALNLALTRERADKAMRQTFMETAQALLPHEQFCDLIAETQTRLAAMKKPAPANDEARDGARTKTNTANGN